MLGPVVNDTYYGYIEEIQEINMGALINTLSCADAVQVSDGIGVSIGHFYLRR